MTKDTLLYTMDSGDAQDSMDRAQISVQQAQISPISRPRRPCTPRRPSPAR